MNKALKHPWSITAQGDRTLILTLDAPVSAQNGRKCANIATALRHAEIRGVVDIVPTFTSVAVHYQPKTFGSSTSYKNLAKEVTAIVNQESDSNDTHTSRTIEIPVCYGGKYGPDLPYVAKHCKLAPEEVIAIHSNTPSYVFMLGFAPGAPYVGMHDQAIHIGRRATPRTAVPKGSVAIANCQTIIYPNISPGGWHIIGTTPLEIFFPYQDPPTLLEPGNTIRFVPISETEFNDLLPKP